jgi:tetratricopeptide (TPR) repeat protein
MQRLQIHNERHETGHADQVGPAATWRCILLIASQILGCAFAHAAESPGASTLLPGVIVELLPSTTNNARVLCSHPNEAAQPASVGMQLHLGGRLEVLRGGLAKVRWQNGDITTASPGVIQAPEAPEEEVWVRLVRGLFSFTGRSKTGMKFRTDQANGGSQETVFEVEVDEARTVVTVVEGTVTVTGTNALGPSLALFGEGPRNASRCVVERGQAPQPLPATNIVQWWLYYPGLINISELRLPAAARQLLSASVRAYAQGDLKTALNLYPEGRQPDSDSERIYLAALRMSAADPAGALELVAQSRSETSLGNAVRTLVAAVNHESADTSSAPASTTEWLARSYLLQSQHAYEKALMAAQQAAKADDFGYAWERLAELYFGQGDTKAAKAALQRALRLSPFNAQARALEGFLNAADNDVSEARKSFDEAIRLDPSLGNAWLGRGLCRIRRGDTMGGLTDLRTAAALEPNRALLRSYLAKGFHLEWDAANAFRELAVAKGLDSNDPTAWLYSALLKQQENRINEGISDLEESIDKNDNRRLYRSRLLLDQDRAVRGANLAGIYRDAGMTDVSVREAARAVTYDYANSSAHLFLSDSYNELRDPTRFNLRYETTWFNELLLANLLAPVGGGRLAQHVSQQEYSKLFESDGLHLANSTLVRTDGIITEGVSQYGTFRNTSYAFDLDYEHNDGIRPNNDLSRIEWYTTLKQQVTPQDSAFALIKYEDYHSGDNFQYYDQSQARPDYRFDESQNPIVVAGWHHEWSPGIHTLLLGGRLENEQQFRDRAAPQLVLDELADGSIASTEFKPYDIRYQNELEVYLAELNQIVQWERVTLTAGARYQGGTIQTKDLLYNASPAALFTPSAASVQENLERITGYAYLTLEPVERLWVTGGFAQDDLSFPRNFRSPPISVGQDHSSQFGPKAALVWSPIPETTLRGIYARSLGGVSLDESYRLEPTQLAGFPQTFRSLISESMVGSVSAPQYETIGLALDLKLGPRTYAGIQAERLKSSVDRTQGVFILQNGVVRGSTPEDLDYREDVLRVSVNQLIGPELAIGAAYQVIAADLHDVLTEVPVSALPTANQNERATLHQASAYVLLNHPSGFFAEAEVNWYHQHNSGFTPDVNGDDFFQENLFLGYRFYHRHAELRLGIRNLGDQDYHLTPLTYHEELPRTRVFEARLNFLF